jgi:hypothetical protein
MMVHTGRGVAAEAQHEMFRRVREHARQANDRRPVKSPAESLLALLNVGGGTWEKLFHTEPEPVAARVLEAVENNGLPCLLMVSRGMHWVVAFGRTRREDGSAAGVLLRDPAWAGMPRFFGLTTLPEKPTFQHTAHDPCTCLASDNPPGSVHERYMALEELLSPRGLQGSPDWEGNGALALVPAETRAAAALPLTAATAPLAGLTPQQAAMQEARDHGLFGRADAPPDWQAVMDGGAPGQPILVKDPNDPRDDFWLVPVHPRQAPQDDVTGHAMPAPPGRTAWIMLDKITLRLREASLLDNWTAPAFPTEQDAANLCSQNLTLPDGTRTRFQKKDLRANQRNLVWQASAASILPYWPVKEFTAAHPVTGEQVPVYITQHGEVYAALTPEDALATSDKSDSSVNRPAKLTVPVLCAVLGVAAGYAFTALEKPAPASAPSIVQENQNQQTARADAETAKQTAAGLEKENTRLRSRERQLLEEIKKLKSTPIAAPPEPEPAPASPAAPPPAEPVKEEPRRSVRPAESPAPAPQR